ncbi:MAG: hypothetical protein H7329_05910 [Opitutaceae bacterium]|nr:hypothetical protein [Cytophagales bacterium]
MQNRLYYIIFLLLSLGGHSQPLPSWKYTPTNYKHQLTFQNNSINIGGKTQAFSDSDAIAVFIRRRIDTNYVSAGYGYYKLPGDTLGVTVNLDSSNGSQLYKMYYWDNTNKCQVTIQDSNQLFLNPFGKSQVVRAFGQLPTISYSKASYYQSEISARINASSIAQLSFSSQKNLILNTLTGEIDLANSLPGQYAIFVKSTFCLQNTQLRVQILADTLIVKKDTTQIDLTNLVYDVLKATCNKEGSVFIRESSIKGKGPFNFILSNKSDNSITQSSSGIFEDVKAGIFLLTITDSTGKAAKLQQEIHVAQGEDCNNTVLRPDGKDGLQSLYISESGTARILDRNGEIINKLTIPGEWNCTDQNGKPVPMGDYYLFVNEAKSKVITVLR